MYDRDHASHNHNLMDMRNRVSDALAGDPRTAGAAIEVVAEGSVITLRGEVASPELRQLAEEIAGRQPGVVQVINDLETAPGGEENLPGVSHMAYRESRPPIIPET